jgi:hypothetical protein
MLRPSFRSSSTNSHGDSRFSLHTDGVVEPLIDRHTTYTTQRNVDDRLDCRNATTAICAGASFDSDCVDKLIGVAFTVANKTVDNFVQFSVASIVTVANDHFLGSCVSRF